MGVQTAGALQIVDLRSIDPCAIDPLLAEETAEWRSLLDWDFSKFAALVRRQMEAGRLNGAALLDRGEVAGCGYLGIENAKGLIVDLYIRSAWRKGAIEELLFRVLLNTLIATARVCRIESQLMLPIAVTESPVRSTVSYYVRSYLRLLMTRSVDDPPSRNRAPPAQTFQIESWRESLHDSAAAVLAAAHVGHIDCRISEQYQTVAGAARLLANIVHLQIADTFCGSASFVAIDRLTASPVGLVLASFVADGVGHITELCVTPEAQGAGLGYELLRQSIAALRQAGADRVTLTVTAENRTAVDFYLRSGFREARRFQAYVWERG